MAKFSLKRYSKKHGENSYIVCHTDLNGKFNIRTVLYEDVDKFQKTHYLITGPNEGRNSTPYPRYAVSEEIQEKFIKEFKK